MAISEKGGLGSDGYLRLRKADVYGTLNSSGTYLDLPCLFDTELSYKKEMIENSRVINQRSKVKPTQGREMVSGTIEIDSFPSQLGLLFNLFLGSSSGVKGADNFYTHTYNFPTNQNETVGNFFDVYYVQGTSIHGVNYISGVINSLEMSVSVNENLKTKMQTIFNSVSFESSRPSSPTPSLSYPQESPFSFCDITLIDKTNDHEIPMTSLTFSYNLNYRLENFYLGSKNISRPILNGIPELTLTCTTDGAASFLKQAYNYQYVELELLIKSMDVVDGTQVYETKIAMPSCMLNPESIISNSEEALTQDLEFNCSYGNTVITHIDGVSAH